MLRALGGSALALCAALAAFSITERPVAGQAAQANTYKAPRLADGRPNLNGIWQALNTGQLRYPGAHGEGGAGDAPGPRRSRCPPREVMYLGAVGSVPGGMGVVEGDEIPYKPEALAKKKENQEKWLERDPEIKCYLPGVPRATYMPYPFQIFQSQSQFFIAYEYAGAVRNIFLKDPGPRPSTPGWASRSAAGKARRSSSWRTGFNDQTWFDRAGNFHSDKLKVTERYTRTVAGPPPVRGDDRGSGDVHAALEDQHAALPAHRAERAADGLQVRRVRRRVDVRRVAEEAAAAVSWKRVFDEV